MQTLKLSFWKHFNKAVFVVFKRAKKISYVKVEYSIIVRYQHATSPSAQTEESIKTRVLSAADSSPETDSSVPEQTLRALYDEHPRVTLEDVLELKILVTVPDDRTVEECVDRTLALTDEILDL